MNKTINKNTIGGRIKAARKELGMTQEELAEMMDKAASESTGELTEQEEIEDDAEYGYFQED